jgi:threonine synthase
MKFYSTEGKVKMVDFKTALLRGLAEDGGLYMPEVFPRIQIPNPKIQNILKEFIDIPEKDLKKICEDAFNFPVPLIKLDENLQILELFHGPTLSFKDFGARFMARAMNYYLAKSGEKLNIIVATSGDTGSAVASGFYGLSNIKVFVLYPSKRISPLQEKQIATLGKNIIALEVKGDFDDCQRLAKEALADEKLRKKINISSANSINIGRLLPQMYYYFHAFNQLTKQLSNQVTNFVVPSGNFGNLTAGLFAKKVGLPVKKFIAAVNKNSIIPEYLKSGKLKNRKSEMTYSSAMDVGKPSNLARILDLYGSREAIKKDVEAIAITESETKKTIAAVYKKYNYVIDPHTAVGVTAALKYRNPSTKIVLSTAHPAKFKEIVESAIGNRISLPKSLAEVSKKSKKSILMKAEYKEFYKIISQ